MLLRIWLCWILVWTGCQSPDTPPHATTDPFDWQGHRGARGLLPENTIPAFLKALELGMTTLELDLAVSADSQLIVSHEPWLSPKICRKADGTPLSPPDTAWNIYHMPADALRQFDCGSWGHPDFPEQQAMAAHKPTLDAVVSAVRQWCHTHNKPLPRFNIEIKSRPEWDGHFTPPPKVFVHLVLQVLERLSLLQHSNIQSFDPRVLRHVRTMAPQLPLAFLIDSAGTVAQQLDRLGFIPEIYSPYYRLVTAHTVKACHERGMKIIPWTVNDPDQMCVLIQLGVDGLITDYPNRAAQLSCR